MFGISKALYEKETAADSTTSSSALIREDPATGLAEFPVPGDTKKHLLPVLVDPEESASGRVPERMTDELLGNGDRDFDAQFKDFWMPDRLCKVCYGCEDAFTMYRRKHHCRMCGQIFCNQCSSHYIDGVRACRLCHDQISERSHFERHAGTMGDSNSKLLRRRAASASSASGGSGVNSGEAVRPGDGGSGAGKGATSSSGVAGSGTHGRRGGSTSTSGGGGGSSGAGGTTGNSSSSSSSSSARGGGGSGARGGGQSGRQDGPAAAASRARAMRGPSGGASSTRRDAALSDLLTEPSARDEDRERRGHVANLQNRASAHLEAIVGQVRPSPPSPQPTYPPTRDP